MAKGTTRVQAYEREIEAFFLSAGSVWGYGAATLEPSGTSHWDAQAIASLHGRRLDEVRRRELGKVEAVRHRLAGLSRDHLATLVATFTPRPWDAALRAACGKAGEHATLAGLVVCSSEAYAAFAERRKRPPHDLTELGRHLAEFARTEARARVFAPLVRAARRRLDEALLAYHAVVRMELERKASESRALYAALRAGAAE